MRRFILLSALVGWFLFVAQPVSAMMGGMHGGMHSGSGSEYDSGTQQPSETQTWQNQGEQGGAYQSDQSGASPQGRIPKNKTSRPSIPKTKKSKQKIEKSSNSTAKGSSTRTSETVSTKTPAGPASEASPPAQGAGKLRIQMTEKPILKWRDETVMHLVPGGDLKLGKNAGSIEVGGFYMDETQVTNLQYMEFLNKVLPRIQVENGVVKRDGKIWLLLGEVKDGYEPIIYENGQFAVTGPQHTACAVLRVTAYGASAYAEFYGKRLPTEMEWFYAARTGDSNPQQLPVPSPVVLYKPNDYKVRGLNSNIREWGIQIEKSATGKASGEKYVVMGVASSKSARSQSKETAISRYPWEAFAEVGFRTVLPLPQTPLPKEIKENAAQGGS